MIQKSIALKNKERSKMINKLEQIIKELEMKIVDDYFQNEIVFNLNENDTEYISIQKIPYEIDKNDNMITELERDLDLDWNYNMELDTKNRMIVIKKYSMLW